MKINKSDYIEMCRTKPWQQKRFIKLAEDCGFRKSISFNLMRPQLGVGSVEGYINSYATLKNNITDQFIAWLKENPAYCIDVSGFDIEKKKRVQDAFVKLGFKPISDITQADLIKLTTVDADGHIGRKRLMWGHTEILEAQKPYEVTYEELMEIADMKNEVNLKALLKDGMSVCFRNGLESIFLKDEFLKWNSHDNTWSPRCHLREFSNDLTHFTQKEWGIIHITDRDGAILFEREEEAKEMTVAEIEAKLGHKVKVVK